MRIYLAAPYSHSNPAVRQARFALVNKAAAELMLMGYEVFSPISMGHVICEAASLPTVFSFLASELPFVSAELGNAFADSQA